MTITAMYRVITTLFIFLLGMQTLLAEDELLPDNQKTIVSEIEIRGAKRTEEYVIRRELLFTEGDEITGEMIRESVQRLKNTLLFSKVLPYLQIQAENKTKIIIEVEEKWTLIPLFGLALGGGSQRASMQIYDINTLGRFYTTGLGYENFNGEHSGSFTFRNPRLFDRRLSLLLEVIRSQSPRSLYQTNGERTARYLLQRNSVGAVVRNEFKPWLNVGIGTVLSRVHFTDAQPEPTLAPDLLQQITQSNEINAHKFRVSFNFGRLNYDNYLVEGKESELLIETATPIFGADDSFTRFYWSNTAHWRFAYQSNLSLNFAIAATTSNALQNLYFVGGLDDVRGYSDGQFRNRAYWKLNSEFRIPSLKTRWLVLQHIFFIDAAEAAARLSDLNASPANIYPSIGIGVRIISPKIYSATGRGDIAYPLSDTRAPALSLGAQQFF